MALSDFKSFDECDALFRNSKGRVKDAPVLPRGVRVVDAHCHLGMLDDVALALARCAHHGVRFLECITDPAEESGDELSAQDTYGFVDGWLEQAQQILESWGEGHKSLPVIRFACGVHPHNARNWDASKGQLVDLLKNPLTSCLGEIGLDYHYDMSPRPRQREVFALQLRLAQEAGLPVQLHIREAHEEALEILRYEGCPQAGTVLHCFNLGPEDLAPFLELGCYVSLGGPITFKKEFATRAAALDVPLDRLLTETDAPFMAPEPLRGVSCQPDQTVYTLRMLLDCFGYAGQARALEVVNPRDVDVAAGAVPCLDHNPDFMALQCGQDATAFCALIYRNAVQLLNRPLTPWQEA